jgi:branched-chain amino acid transport system substrate-binding protein
VRAANEINLAPKLFGGTMVGLLATNIKMQLGPLLNGIVNHEDFVPGPSFNFPGVEKMLATYRAKAQGQGVDPLGYAFAPFAYAAGQVLAAAVGETKSLDHDKLAAHIHAHQFKTVVGDIAFGGDGEWAQSRMMFTQFQNVTGNDIDQFKDSTREVIVWPAEYKTGNLVYPYSEARKK